MHLSKTKQIISFFFFQFLSLFSPVMAALRKTDQVQCFSDFDGSFRKSVFLYGISVGIIKLGQKLIRSISDCYIYIIQRAAY